MFIISCPHHNQAFTAAKAVFENKLLISNISFNSNLNISFEFIKTIVFFLEENVFDELNTVFYYIIFYFIYFGLNSDKEGETQFNVDTSNQRWIL